jgi:hypothetical protein
LNNKNSRCNPIPAAIIDTSALADIDSIPSADLDFVCHTISTCHGTQCVNRHRLGIRLQLKQCELNLTCCRVILCWHAVTGGPTVRRAYTTQHRHASIILSCAYKRQVHTSDVLLVSLSSTRCRVTHACIPGTLYLNACPTMRGIKTVYHTKKQNDNSSSRQTGKNQQECCKLCDRIALVSPYKCDLSMERLHMC